MIDPLALARESSTDADLAAAYEHAGRKVPSDLLTARDDAAAAAAPAPEAPISEDQTETAAAPATGTAEAAADSSDEKATRERRADGTFAPKRLKVKVADGDEPELGEDEARALILAQRNRPVYEENLKAQRQQLEADRQMLAQERQQIEAARAERAQAQRELAEAKRLREYVLYAEAERDAGRIPSVREFLTANPGPLPSFTGSTPNPATPSVTSAQSGASEERVRQILAEERARIRSEMERVSRDREVVRKGEFFNDEVRSAIEKSPHLKDQPYVYLQAITGAISDHMRDQHIDPHAIPDAGLRGLIAEAANYFDMQEKNRRLKITGQTLDQHAGKTMPAATPAAGTGTPTPTSAVAQGDPWSPENIRRLNDQNRGDMLKTITMLDRAERSFHKDLARSAGH